MINAIAKKSYFRMAAALLTLTLATASKALAQEPAEEALEPELTETLRGNVNYTLTVIAVDLAIPQEIDGRRIVSDQDFGQEACEIVTLNKSRDAVLGFLRDAIRLALHKNKPLKTKFDSYCAVVLPAVKEKYSTDSAAEAKYDAAYYAAIEQCRKRGIGPYTCVLQSAFITRSEQEKTNALMASRKKYKDVTRAAFVEHFGRKFTANIHLGDYTITLTPPDPHSPAP
jgi:hypothetical protein